MDTSTDLSIDDMLVAVRNMAGLNPAGVILTGGEPLFRPGIEHVIAELGAARIPIFIETNAMLIDDDLVELALGIERDGGRINFSVSVDGGTASAHDWCRGRGSFVDTVAGMRRLRSAGLTVDIQCVINRRNWATLGDLAALAADLQVDYLKFVMASPVGRATRFQDDLSIPFSDAHAALGILAEAISTYTGKVMIKVPPAMIPPSLQPVFRSLSTGGGCSVTNITSCSFPLLGVLPDGSVTICAATRDSAEAYFGDIRELSLTDVWRAENLDTRRERYLGAELEGVCGDCVFKHDCRGACRAYAFAETGSFEGPYPICAEMERQGWFPDAYRISRLTTLRDRVTALQAASAG